MLLSEVVDADISFRCESEFFKKKIMLAKASIENCPTVSFLTEVAPDIQHPVEITRAYAESGHRMLLAQEVRCNQIVLGEGSYLDNPSAQFVKRNKLKVGDVVLTRTGANFGQCAPVLFDDELFACADLLIIRKGAIPAGYLSTFFNTWQGRLLLDRGAYGAAQPHIAPTYLKNLPIPIFSNLIEPISKLVERSAATRAKGLEAVVEAEKYLLNALALDNWTPPTPLSYVRSSNDAFSAGRLDSQFFAPRVSELMKRLGQDALKIGDVAPARHERFKPSDAGSFNYIEIGGLGSDGTAVAETLPQKEAPSRATQFVRAGDIITSTVRPIRRLSALIAEEQDGDVCSSGFVVLTPQKISSEVLLTYLRLPLFCELMDLHTSATMYPAISEADLLSLPIPAIDTKTQIAIQQSVQEAAAKRQRASSLLEAAKRAVEIAIEDSEAAALAYLKGVI